MLVAYPSTAGQQTIVAPQHLRNLATNIDIVNLIGLKQDSRVLVSGQELNMDPIIWQG